MDRWKFSSLVGVAFLLVFGEWELTGNGGFSAGVFFTLGVVALAEAYREKKGR